MKIFTFIHLFTIFFSFNSMAQQGGGIFPPGIFGPPVRSDIQVDLGYQNDNQSDVDPTYRYNSLDLLYMPKDSNWFVSGNYRESQITKGKVTLEDGIQVDGGLSNQQVSYGYVWNKGQDSTWSLIGGLGSTSDEAFEDFGDNTYRLSLVNIRKQEGGSAWILGAFFNNNLNVGVPVLPIVAYSTQFYDWINLTIGMPFLNLNLGKRGRTSMNILFTPGNARAVIRQPIVGPFALSGGFVWEAEGFQHLNRLNDEDQFFIERQSYFLGFQAPIIKGLMGRLNFGHRVNSRYFQAEGVFDDAQRKFDISDSTYIEARLFIRM